MISNLSKTQADTLTLNYVTPSLSVRVEAGGKKTNIVFQTLTPVLTTGRLPKTQEILQEKFPGVFKTKCGNYHGQSFYDEVKDTEVGHMFEHILIQNMQEMKESCSDGSVKFSAVTEWDWTINPKGMYTISIESTCDHKDVLAQAMRKSINLTELVLNSHS